jgi:hypothetical protein
MICQYLWLTCLFKIGCVFTILAFLEIALYLMQHDKKQSCDALRRKKMQHCNKIVKVGD